MKFTSLLLITFSVLVNYSSCQGAGAKARIRQALLGLKEDDRPADRGTGVGEAKKPTAFSKKFCEGYEKSKESAPCYAYCFNQNANLNSVNVQFPDKHKCAYNINGICLGGRCYSDGSNSPKAAGATELCRSKGYKEGYDFECEAYCVGDTSTGHKSNFVNYPDGHPANNGFTCKDGKLAPPPLFDFGAFRRG